MRVAPKTIVLGLVPALLVVLAATVTTVVMRSSASSVKEALGRPVQPGGDYYLFIPLIELSERRPDGENWDSGESSAPDPYVEVFWQGHRVYQSSTKADTFVAKWSNSEVNIPDLALQRKASVEDTLAAARIHVQPGETIEIRVYDEDPLGTSDLAGALKIDSTELRVGEETRLLAESGVKRLVLRVVPLGETPELLK